MMRPPKPKGLRTVTEEREPTVVSRAGARSGRIKGFKPHPTAFLGYLISHESHHRGQVATTLKANGHALDRKIAYGIWEWGVR